MGFKVPASFFVSSASFFVRPAYHSLFLTNYQGPEHPHPGQAYSGTSRTAYLPDNKEGNEVLKLLQISWDRKLTFTIGTSVTSGASNCVIWAGVHHKVGF
jgi:deltex-like protein